ncbi:MAG: acetyl-CoA carboxylase carboxyltransferase subunit alpha [Marvinbryantia sp.]|jgi:acetyl-CoA carboxylase carboxyl transferase beta subunit/acetyl-CoA carboxylase carboxyl transferase alpha subunit
MKLDNMFKKTKRSAFARNEYKSVQERPEVPKGLLKKCPKCGGVIMTDEVENGYYICPRCGGYFHMPALRRLEMIVDADTFEEWDTDLAVKNPMEYKGYPEKIAALKEKTGLDEAVMTGCAKISGCKTVLGICDGRFLMASMGEAVGEKIARAVERATEEKLPVILFACSGGARMQEGIISLMQMAKTSAALRRHSEAGLLYISVLTDPTTGGVTASFAMLGDIILAEPGALIGFAGPRVVEQTIRQKLPKGFQRAEFLLEHGFLDAIVERPKLKETLSSLLVLHGYGKEQESVIQSPEKLILREKHRLGMQKLTAWERVQLSRGQNRPIGSDFIRELFTDFMEFHGDRLCGDDKAVIGGMAYFCGRPVTILAQAKGGNTKENIERNFGMPKPEGYRKAQRLMKQAEKFGRPIICFVDTPGAFCGMEAEERGQGEAIAKSIYQMSGLTVPILSVIIGEGGSDGALAMAMADEVWMLENSVYSILSPEGFATILWKDSTKAKEAAEVMKLTAEHLHRQGIVEQVFAEPKELNILNLETVTDPMKVQIQAFLEKYGKMSAKELTEHRYQRFRKF